MALIIKPKENKKIEVPGLDITLEQLYVRIEFAGRADGKTLEVAPASYMNKAKYESNEPCLTNVPMQGMRFDLQPGEVQTLETAHEKMKEHFVSLGYNVQIQM